MRIDPFRAAPTTRRRRGSAQPVSYGQKVTGASRSRDFRMGLYDRLFHASQVSEFHRVNYDHTKEEFRAMFTNTDFTGDGPPPSVVGYGDIHGTYLEVDLGLTLFNAGSVGNPLDAPGAPYVVLEGEIDAAVSCGMAAVSITFVRVPYDVEAEIAVARELGMPDVDAYALELREQLYRGSAFPPSS